MAYLPILLLSGALLATGTEGRVRSGGHGNDPTSLEGQGQSAESRSNIKSLVALIRMLVTQNSIKAEASQSRRSSSELPHEIGTTWSDIDSKERAGKAEESIPIAMLVSKRSSDKNTDDKGEHLNPTDFSNAANIPNGIDEIPEGSKDPTENHGVKNTDFDFLEGDIVHDERQGRNMIKDPNEKWPRGEIPYVIASGFTSRDRATIAKAVLEFERNTCIRVRPLSPTDDARDGYVRIIKGDGCYSSVGRQVSNPGQELSLGDGCLYPGIVVHEFMHALGFWHEQSRPDRDQHIEIHYGNIQTGKEYNFKMYSSNQVQVKGTQYDVGSIMHYGPYAFAKDRSTPTITALHQTSVTMGQREGLSHHDIKKINTLYGCQDVTAPPPPIQPEECTDKNMHCEAWAKTDECTTNPLCMKMYCAKSCKTCTDQSCQDLNKYCAAWAETGECAATPSYMNLYCKKSCGLCGAGCKDGNLHCAAWADGGECKKNPDYMHVYCQKSCRRC